MCNDISIAFICLLLFLFTRNQMRNHKSRGVTVRNNAYSHCYTVTSVMLVTLYHYQMS